MASNIVMMFHTIIGQDLIKTPYTVQPATPKQNIMYIGKETVSAGIGLLLQIKIIWGINEIVVTAPDKKPKTSTTRFFIRKLSAVFS